jgi:hypothetical protein
MAHGQTTRVVDKVRYRRHHGVRPRRCGEAHGQRIPPFHAASPTTPSGHLSDRTAGHWLRKNGAFGERADARGNTLPTAMSVRVGHRQIPTDRASLAAAYPAASGRLVMLVHGLVETERSWFSRTAARNDFGSRLATTWPAARCMSATTPAATSPTTAASLPAYSFHAAPANGTGCRCSWCGAARPARCRRRGGRRRSGSPARRHRRCTQPGTRVVQFRGEPAGGKHSLPRVSRGKPGDQQVAAGHAGSRGASRGLPSPSSASAAATRSA